MSSYNRVILMGNLTRDPMLKYTPAQTAVAEFGLAVNRKFKGKEGDDREEVAFVDCTAFGNQAETINQYCQKGKQLLIEGRLKFDSWEDKNGGGKRSKLTVVVEGFQFVGGRPEGEQGDDAPPARQAPARGGAQRVVARPVQRPAAAVDDDIPF